MNLTRPFQPWLLLLFIVLAIIVRPAVLDRALIPPESSLLPSQSSSIHRLNQTSLSPDVSADRLAVYCDGDEYGRDLMAADCRDAITGIKRSRQVVRFGERTAAPDTWDVGLPSRQIGSEDTAEEISLVSLPCHLTSEQYRDFARFNWSSSLVDHPHLLPHLTYSKLPSPC